MAIVNLTADSFTGDGSNGDLARALRRAEEALEQGADIIDLGAESTRPGADPVPQAQELERVIRLVEALVSWRVPISVDTLKPVVMKAALTAGADMVNDVNGFRAEGAVEAVRDSQAALCVVHMAGEPRSMQLSPCYSDVVAEVGSFLSERVQALKAAGIESERILLDPGFGFGKSVEHNFSMLKELERFRIHGLPVLAGLSRKSMLGAVTGRTVEERIAASIAAALIAVQRGAAIVRVHDVAATRDAMLVWQAVS